MTQTREQTKALVHHLADSHRSWAHLAHFLGSQAGHRLHRRHALGGAVFATGHRERDRGRAARRRRGEYCRPAFGTGDGDETFLIRMPVVPEGSGRKTELTRALESWWPVYRTRILDRRRCALDEIRNRAILAVALASVGILLYMAYAFRNTQSPSSMAARRWSRCFTTCLSC